MNEYIYLFFIELNHHISLYIYIQQHECLSVTSGFMAFLYDNHRAFVFQLDDCRKKMT